MSAADAPEIPGYRLLDELGRGGMATVWRALQRSVEREVALKIMSPVLLADPSYGLRFLREARIAARLQHRHVVAVYDVGSHGNLHYIAMEYLPGGAVIGRSGSRPDLLFSLRVVRETAAALDYAHRHGFVHRDVKPDNILLRADGSAVLTDFGIARANDSLTRMTRTGAVVGTPYYMSPEQARGLELDGRADLYSLGVVLYELLVGRVPFHAPEALSVALKHVTEPVPRLPASLAALQPLLDRALAKLPEQRFQSGAELVAAIEDIEYQIARGELPELAVPDRDFLRRQRLAETRAELARYTPPESGLPRAASVPEARADRAGPQAASLDEVVAEASRLLGTAVPTVSPQPAAARSSGPDGDGGAGAMPRISVADPVARVGPRRRSARRRRWPWLLAVLALAVLGHAGWSWWPELVQRLPDPRGDALLTALDQQLAAPSSEVSALLSAFEALRNHLPAGDARLSSASERLLAELLRRADQARSAGDLEIATRWLDAAAAAGAEAALIAPRRAELERGLGRPQRIEQWLAEAVAALEAGDEDQALRDIERVLELEPRNALALELRQRVGLAELERAEQALAEGAFEAAESALEEAVRRGAPSARVAELRTAMARALEDQRAQRQRLLSEARAFAAAGRLAGSEDSALARYEALLRLDPADAEARAGRQALAPALVEQAEQAIAARDARSAAALLRQAQDLQPRLTGLGPAREALARLERELEREREVQALSPAQLAMIAEALAASREALQAGRYIDPPGESAYDHLRRAQAISAFHPEVIATRRASGAVLREQAEQAIATGRLERAHELYDAAEVFQPAHADNQVLQQRLVDALERRIEEASAAGEQGHALAALERLELLAPQHPRRDALRRRAAGR